jgi:hypothetical protein
MAVPASAARRSAIRKEPLAGVKETGAAQTAAPVTPWSFCTRTAEPADQATTTCPSVVAATRGEAASTVVSAEAGRPAGPHKRLPAASTLETYTCTRPPTS